MFQGTTAGRLDEKGRLAIPAKFRAELEASDEQHLVVTAKRIDDGIPCLEALTQDDWSRVLDWVETLPPDSTQRSLVETVYVGSAVRCQLDGQGRILIPATLRGMGGLSEREVMIVGVGKKFRVLSRQAHQDAVARYFNASSPLRSGADGDA